tara:strand:+ start:171 stop:401 length:231 start_codon:yes stop_codon:yes gene_type:complete
MSNGKYIKVEGHSNLARDPNNGAIININASEMTQSRVRKYNWKKQQNEIKNLRNELSDMKQLLNKLIEDKDGRNSN